MYETKLGERIKEGTELYLIPSFDKSEIIKSNPIVEDKRIESMKSVIGGVLGKKYESKERCYKGLGITKKSVQNHMKKTSCMFEEAVVYCYEKKLEKQFEFRREIYKSYNACCTAYNLAQEYVAIKAKREKITRQEAMEKLLAQRESEKTI